jgi:hypothetical protein
MGASLSLSTVTGAAALAKLTTDPNSTPQNASALSPRLSNDVISSDSNDSFVRGD